MLDRNSGIGVNEGGPGNTSCLCLRCGVGVCTSISRIHDSRAGVALGRQGVPSPGPSTLVGVGAGSSGGGGGGGGMSLSSGSPSNTSSKSRGRSSRSGSGVEQHRLLAPLSRYTIRSGQINDSVPLTWPCSALSAARNSPQMFVSSSSGGRGSAISQNRPQSLPPYPPPGVALMSRRARLCHHPSCSYRWMTSSKYTLRGRLKRSAHAVQLFGRLAVLETHTLRY